MNLHRPRRNAAPAQRVYMPADKLYGKSRRLRRSIPNAADFMYEESRDEHGLTPSQVEAFREVFNLFDINGGGTIDADELDEALRTVDIQLTHQEILDVLQVIDEDGNGEIDFNEFLTLMTSTEQYLETIRGMPKDSQKENLLFTALTKFMKKSALSSLSEIERYYHSKMRKAPHVVGHYAAGARLIGLTEKQIAKRLATLSATGGKDNDSPYAQPLCRFKTTVPANMLEKRRTHGKIRLVIRKATDEENKAASNGGEEGEEQSSSSNPLPDADSSAKKLLPPVIANSSPKHQLQRLRKSHMQLRMVPLPAVSMKRGGKSAHFLTIEDIPMIREKVNRAYEQYRQKQDAKRELISQSSAFTDLSLIPSLTMQRQFYLILEAYNFRPTNIPPGLNTQTWAYAHSLTY